MIEKVIYKKKLQALIVRGKYRNKKGITFFTPKDSVQQFGYMKHKKTHIIKPHLHQKRKNTKISHTSEVLLIMKGSIRVDFYNSSKKYCDLDELISDSGITYNANKYNNKSSFI